MTDNREEIVQAITDGLIERLGLEPDGHKTWATTTDEIVKEVGEELSEQLPKLFNQVKISAYKDGYLAGGKAQKAGEFTVEDMLNKTTIEMWKLDLERLLWSYHENGRPDGKTGVIGNPKTIQEFVQSLLSLSTQKAREEDGLLSTRYDFAINYDKSLYGKYGILQNAEMVRVQKDGWAIRCVGERLTRTGKWVYEPLPSSRTDSFKKRTTFTYEEAREKMKEILSTLSTPQEEGREGV